MSNKPKSTVLYTSPFSKAYWRDAAAELKDTHMLVFAALMIALRLVLKQVAIPLTPFLKINTAFFVNALGAMAFGPVMAAICAVITDVLGYLLKPEGIYFVPFVLTEVAGSVVFALFLYRAKVTTTRVMLSRFTINFFINVALQTPIMMWYYALYMDGKQYTFAMAVPGILKNVMMFPLEAVLLTLFLSVMLPITAQLGLTHTGSDARETLKFTTKRIVTLVILFFVGVGCVFGYLNYYYNSTSRSASYTTEQRVASNQGVQQVVENSWELDAAPVTIVEKAMRPLFGDETAYTVGVYAASGDITDAMWAYSKSKAAKDERLTRLGTAEFLLNEKTGEVTDFVFAPADH